jgi:hypothetical protein
MTNAPAPPRRVTTFRSLLAALVGLLLVLAEMVVGAAPAAAAREFASPTMAAAYAYDEAARVAHGTPASVRPPALLTGPVGKGSPAAEGTSVVFRGFAVAAETGVDAVDVAANRVTLRVGTKAEIRANAPKTADGDFIDPNTGQVIPKDGPFDYGHQPGYEWWRTQQIARDQGWTRQQLIEYENDASHFQIEDPASNRSHAFEMPR